MQSDNLFDIFNASATSFTEADHVYKEVGQRLIEHLAPIKIQPQRILDLGSGCGTLLPLLQQQFPQAEIVAVDIADQRLAVSQQLNSNTTIDFVTADATELPFTDQHFDLVISNLMLHWLPDIPSCFQQVKRMLKTNGLFALTCFGPDSFVELGRSQTLIDMHNIGDEMIRCGLTHPILDSEVLTVEYDSVDDAITDLNANGEIALIDSVKTDLGELDLSYEIIYGHAWKDQQPMTSKIDQDGMVRIDASKIPIKS